MPGPAPKPASKRRRHNKPKSLRRRGADDRTGRRAVRDASSASTNPHPLITAMWDTVQQSCESRFYSEADWQRLRLELWYANQAMASGRPSGQAWAAIQHGLTELLM